MRFASVLVNGRARVALAHAGGVVPVSESTMLEIINRVMGKEDEAARLADKAEGVAPLAEEDYEWLPPVRGGKIASVAINNEGVSRLASVVPATPPFFLKPTSCLIGHLQPIIMRPDYGLTHPEAELAVIIGRRSKHLTHENALQSVFGYTIINDVTSIGLKSEDTYVFPAPEDGPTPPGFEYGAMQLAYHARSKGTDTFGPLGPWIVTKDEIADPNHLAVRVFMGEQQVTCDNTANLRFSVEDVLVWASRYFTLEPGDIIHMGTAAAGRFGLRELDFRVWEGPIAIEIEGIGRLENPIDRVDLTGNRVGLIEPDPANVWPPRYAA